MAIPSRVATSLCIVSSSTKYVVPSTLRLAELRKSSLLSEDVVLWCSRSEVVEDSDGDLAVAVLDGGDGDDLCDAVAVVDTDLVVLAVVAASPIVVFVVVVFAITGDAAAVGCCLALSALLGSERGVFAFVSAVTWEGEDGSEGGEHPSATSTGEVAW